MTNDKWIPTNSYNPSYDPLKDNSVGCGDNYAPSYWIGIVKGDPPTADGAINADKVVDVAIIGSGYTGLSCAYNLAKDYGIKACVLEANAVAWGCSSRNGGQAQGNMGRLKRSAWAKAWGLDVAKAMHKETVEATEFFASIITDNNIDCIVDKSGHYYIAHRQSITAELSKEISFVNTQLGMNSKFLNNAELLERGVADAESKGAMYEQYGVAINSGEYAYGLVRAVRKLGATIHPSSPVQRWDTVDGVHHLHTPNGIVKAKKVAVCSAAYATQNLHPRLKNRLLPVLSNSLTTRVLTESELAEIKLSSNAILTDTRILRNYYRLMPDNRLQFGSRSAITGRGAPKQKYLTMLKNSMYRKYPTLKGIELDYYWWGFVDVSHDMMPRITGLNDIAGIYYAMGYGGNGVMYSAQAGRRLAQLVASDKSKVPNLPIFNNELRHEGILTPFRRIGQAMLYKWYWLQDEHIK